MFGGHTLNGLKLINYFASEGRVPKSLPVWMG